MKQLTVALFILSRIPANAQYAIPLTEKNYISRNTLVRLDPYHYLQSFGVKINNAQAVPYIPDEVDTLTLHEVDGWFTLRVPPGQQYHAALSYGITVMLNAGSSLKFQNPAFLDGAETSLYLEGEALFIIRDRVTPLEIHLPDNLVFTTQGATVNITAYPDDPVFRFYTLWGQVRTNLHRPAPFLLDGMNMTTSGVLACWYRAPRLAGDIAITNYENYLDNMKSYVYLPANWISGTIPLIHEDIYSTFRKVGRWYNRTIIFRDSLPGVSITANIRDLISALQIVKEYGLSSYLKGDSIILYKNRNPKIPATIDNREF